MLKGKKIEEPVVPDFDLPEIPQERTIEEVMKVAKMPDDFKALIEKKETIKCHAAVPFIDGGLREPFAKLGYGVYWRLNEVRELPLWLFNRCENSGAVLVKE